MRGFVQVRKLALKERTIGKLQENDGENRTKGFKYGDRNDVKG